MAQSIYPSLAYEDAARAIVWLRDAFGFEARLVVPGPGAYGERGEGEGGAGATIAHAELRTETGDVLMLLSTQLSTRRNRSPRTLGGTAQSVYVTVPDVDLAHDRAVRAGAEVFNPLHETDYGSREFCCLDPEGHIWTFGSYQPE